VGRIKENVEEVNSTMIYLIHCKNLCKCHNVLPLSTTIKGKKCKDYVIVKNEKYVIKRREW
jgi:hypothetical protein